MKAHRITLLLQLYPEEARQEIEKLKRKHGATAEQIAKGEGIAVRTVRRWLSALEMVRRPAR